MSSSKARDLPKFKNNKIVCVDWEDAASNSGYYDFEHPENTTTVNARTVGHLLRNDRKEVTLAAETFQDGEFRHIHSIPKGMVRKITVLRSNE